MAELARIVIADQGAIRDLPIKPELANELQRAVTTVYGADYTVTVKSGAQPAGPRGTAATTGSRRHGTGAAADVIVTSPSGNRLSPTQLQPLGQYWLGSNIGSVGFPADGKNFMHLDLVGGSVPGSLPLAKNEGRVWYYGTPNASQREAMTAGLAGKLPLDHPVPPVDIGPSPLPSGATAPSAPIPTFSNTISARGVPIPTLSPLSYRGAAPLVPTSDPRTAPAPVAFTNDALSPGYGSSGLPEVLRNAMLATPAPRQTNNAQTANNFYSGFGLSPDPTAAIHPPAIGDRAAQLAAATGSPSQITDSSSGLIQPFVTQNMNANLGPPPSLAPPPIPSAQSRSSAGTGPIGNIFTGQGIAGTAQLPSGVRPNVTVPSLVPPTSSGRSSDNGGWGQYLSSAPAPTAPGYNQVSDTQRTAMAAVPQTITTQQQILNPDYTKWASLPGTSGADDPYQNAAFNYAMQNQAPAPPKYISVPKVVPNPNYVPTSADPVMPLTPGQDVLAADRLAAENPLQRLFGMTPLGHLTNFLSGGLNGYGAPQQGGLLGLLSNAFRPSGSSGAAAPTAAGGGLFGALSTPDQVKAQFAALTPQQLGNQNDLARTALAQGSTNYTTPGGLMMPTNTINGQLRQNTYGDYGGASPYGSNGSLVG